MSDFSPEEMLAAARQLQQHGERATQIVSELIEAARANDHHRGGALCREMYDCPDLLLLVVGMLTTTIVNSGVGLWKLPSDPPEPAEEVPVQAWEVGAVDQMQAAAEAQDVNVFGQIALDAQLRAARDDIAAMGGGIPDVETLVQANMMMNHMAVSILAAEALRRLLRQEIDNG